MLIGSVPENYGRSYSKRAIIDAKTGEPATLISTQFLSPNSRLVNEYRIEVIPETTRRPSSSYRETDRLRQKLSASSRV
jgi:hypothetical protein